MPQRIPLEITLVEFPSTSMPATAEFLSTVCGWTPEVFGTSYTHLTGGGIDVGVQGDIGEQSPAPLLVICVSDLEDAQQRVEAAGGVVTFGPVDFPSGRRFHFREPGGNELAMWTPDRERPPVEGSPAGG